MHHPEALLDLVGAVARSAAEDGHVVAAERISMPVFNRVKLDVDAARGIADPRTSPERTPSADAIQMRFKQLAGAPVKWKELVRLSLLPFEKRTMWLSALQREDARADLSDRGIALALRRVAAELSAATVTRDEYVEASEKLIAEDAARYGEEGLLAKLLPTGGQVMHYCKTWEAALRLAGLEVPATKRPVAPLPPPQPSGLPLVQAMAHYAALNGVWPSRPTLRDFATTCGFALPAYKGANWDELIRKAAALLAQHGVEPPPAVRAKPLGKGKRLTYRYPANGVPGAPPASGAPRDDRARLALRRELAVLGVRVWLAAVRPGDSTSQDSYRRWRRGTDFLAPNKFKDFGGFTRMKREALDENARARQEHGEEVPRAAFARVEEVVAQLARPLGVSHVPFGDALCAVLHGPHVERQPPRQ